MTALPRRDGAILGAVDALSVWGVSGLLVAAFADQFVMGELPCPLCILQRVAFVLVGFAFALNLRFGPSPAHYGMAIVAAVAGAVASARQVLLHIAPGDPGYGSALFGLHFYTWALMAFVAAVLFCAAMLMALPWRPERAGETMSGFQRGALWSLLLVTVANAVSTFIECGPGTCPDNPVSYLWWPF